MIDLVWQRLDHGARRVIPFATTLLAAFLSVIPWPLPYFGEVAPPFVFITVYYWSLYRPDLFRSSSAFLIGFIYDVINGLPLGFSALFFVALHQFILIQRKLFTGHSFPIMWFGFSLTLFVVELCEWILLSLLNLHLIPIIPLFFQSLLVIAIFPLPAWLLVKVQRLALTQE